MTTNNTTPYNYKQKYLLFPPGLDRQSKSFGGAGIPLKNKYLFIPATLNKMPDGIAKNDSPARQGFDLERVTGACTRPHYTKQNNRSKNASAVVQISVIPPGLEPGTPTLKVLCSTD